jgi:gluconolactonase
MPPIQYLNMKDSNVLEPQLLRDSAVAFAKASSLYKNDFIAFDTGFYHLFKADGPNLRVLAEDKITGNSFHEAGVWCEKTDDFWFTSNRRCTPEGRVYATLSKINLGFESIMDGQWSNYDCTDGSIVSPNGGTILPNGNLLLCDQGLGSSHPSSLVVVDPTEESRPRVILNNYHGLPFNSLNDVVVVPSSGRAGWQIETPLDTPAASEVNLNFSRDTKAELGLGRGYTILFTDPSYGHEQGFKPSPLLPNQIYSFDPSSGVVRVIADGFVKPNGIVVDEKRQRCYVTDTGFIRGDGDIDPTRPGGM